MDKVGRGPMEPLGHLHRELEISLAGSAQVGQPVRRALEFASQCCPRQPFRHPVGVEGFVQLAYKHAVSTIQPAGAVSIRVGRAASEEKTAYCVAVKPTLQRLER